MNQFDAAHKMVAMEKCIEACVDFFNATDGENVHLFSEALQEVYRAGEMAINAVKRSE